MQLKRIGPTIMVGKQTDREHSYCGLDAEKAIIETVYSKVLGQLLPAGTVNCHGLYKSALTDSGRCWGVILARDPCLRPGHLIPADTFDPKDEYRSLLVNEKIRIKRLYQRLHDHFRQDDNFLAWIKTYFKHAAMQFGVARAMRISHSTISASNIGLDGRWLDLPVCSFVSSGVNHHIFTEFFQEHELALRWGMEIVYYYNKYTRSTFNINELTENYHRQFGRSFSQGIAYMLAIEQHPITQTDSEPWRLIVAYFNQIIHYTKDISPFRPLPNSMDRAYILSEVFYLAAINTKKARHQLMAIDFTGEAADHFLEAAKQLSLILYRKHEDQGSDFLLRGIQSIKRNRLSGCYFLTLLGARARELCENGEPENIGSFIDSYLMASSWIYEPLGKQATIFQTPEITIMIDAKFRYTLTVVGSHSRVFKTLRDLIVYLSQWGRDLDELLGLKLDDYIHAIVELEESVRYFVTNCALSDIK